MLGEFYYIEFANGAMEIIINKTRSSILNLQINVVGEFTNKSDLMNRKRITAKKL